MIKHMKFRCIFFLVLTSFLVHWKCEANVYQFPKCIEKDYFKSSSWEGCFTSFVCMERPILNTRVTNVFFHCPRRNVSQLYTTARVNFDFEGVSSLLVSSKGVLITALVNKDQKSKVKSAVIFVDKDTLQELIVASSENGFYYFDESSKLVLLTITSKCSEGTLKLYDRCYIQESTSINLKKWIK